VRHVLVVDDEVDVCRLVQGALERGGAYRVSIALSGGEALDLLDNPPPDCVIVDAVLPGMSGLEFAERAAARGVPVVMTAEGADASRRLEQEGWAVLRKPVRPAALLQEIEAALRTQAPSRREARPPMGAAQAQSLLQEDPDTVRAAFHLIENFGARAADVADQRAQNASAEDVAKRWVQVARAVRKLKPKL
jgi:DNA-binding response OmpR family regulator